MEQNSDKLKENTHGSCRLDGCEFEQTPGDSGEQRSLAGYSPLGHTELDIT